MDQALWALGRGTGITALVFMTISVVLGIATRSGRPILALPRFGVLEVHRTTALFGTLLVVLHVTTLFADPYAQLKLVDLLVPFIGDYRPVWLGLGTLAFDLLLVVVATSLLRHRLGARVFRAVHWTTYALWPLALIHGVGNGTDSGHIWFLATCGASILLVAAAVVLRLRADYVEYARARPEERIRS
ncbi:sulfoxide reductase heme-binding subunit YedZ [Rhodococcus sp. LBL1]|nr:sulfoxide reductase heme-binding subunit YedZ [Rhodococcus sp. LBL1]MDH6682166.1 sulfoxide reductase heme-binding subunit YedZ [Rhodococcus sp. LBL2]